MNFLFSADFLIQTTSNQSYEQPRYSLLKYAIHNPVFDCRQTPVTPDLFVDFIFRLKLFSDWLTLRKLSHRLSVLFRLMWSMVSGYSPVIKIQIIRAICTVFPYRLVVIYPQLLLWPISLPFLSKMPVSGLYE